LCDSKPNLIPFRGRGLRSIPPAALNIRLLLNYRASPPFAVIWSKDAQLCSGACATLKCGAFLVRLGNQQANPFIQVKKSLTQFYQWGWFYDLSRHRFEGVPETRVVTQDFPSLLARLTRFALSNCWASNCDMPLLQDDVAHIQAANPQVIADLEHRVGCLFLHGAAFPAFGSIRMALN